MSVTIKPEPNLKGKDNEDRGGESGGALSPTPNNKIRDQDGTVRGAYRVRRWWRSNLIPRDFGGEISKQIAGQQQGNQSYTAFLIIKNV